jgi:hypothetical protein
VSGPETPRVQSLCEWLQIATDKLSALAKERIWLEIEAHFADSVESHQAAGRSETEAGVAALAELGDPDAAAKHFRRRHLTEKDTKRVGQISKSWRRPFWLLVGYATDALLYFYFLHVFKRLHAPLFFPAFGIFMCAVLQTIGFFVARGKNSRPDIRLLVLIQILAYGCLMLFFVWLGIWGDWGPCFPMSIFLIRSFVPDLRLWLKLGQVDGVWPESPSRA